MSEPDYIVIRAAPDLPPGFLANVAGRWYDRNEAVGMLAAPSNSEAVEYGAPAVAVPSGRFEVREDGAVAEVWEVRP